MHLLTVIFGPTPTPWAMLFHKEELAQAAFSTIETAQQSKAAYLSITDEFGQRANFTVADIHGFMLEDMEKSKLAHIERGLHQARTQARAQAAAAADPVLKNAAMMQGPPMLSPMGNGRFSS
jgi:hypothetical protein